MKDYDEVALVPSGKDVTPTESLVAAESGAVFARARFPSEFVL